MKHVIVLEFETDKPVDDLTTLVADRIYPMDCIVKPRDVVCTTLAEYLTDVRKRVDVQPLEVHDTITWEPKVVIGGITLPWTP